LAPKNSGHLHGRVPLVRPDRLHFRAVVRRQVLWVPPVGPIGWTLVQIASQVR